MVDLNSSRRTPQTQCETDTALHAIRCLPFKVIASWQKCCGFIFAFSVRGCNGVSVAYLCFLWVYLFRILWIFHDQKFANALQFEFLMRPWWRYGVSVCQPRCQKRTVIILYDFNITCCIVPHLAPCLSSWLLPSISNEYAWHSGVSYPPFNFSSLSIPPFWDYFLAHFAEPKTLLQTTIWPPSRK